MTLQQAAQSALDVQDACNGSGVIFALARAMQAICDSSDRGGTDHRNQHPIVKLYLYKLAELAGMEMSSLSPGYDAAEEACKRIASMKLDNDAS